MGGDRNLCREFNKVEDALEYYSKKYLPYIDELKRRCLFVEIQKGKNSYINSWWSYTEKEETLGFSGFQ